MSLMERRQRARWGVVLGVSAVALPGAPDWGRAQEVSHWDVTWAQAVRIESGGELTIQRWGEARLVLEPGERAGHVRGTWSTPALDVTWTVTGTLDDDGRLRLSATEHDSEDPELEMIESLQWVALIDGDRIEGEMWMVIPRMGRPPARRPWRGNKASGRGVTGTPTTLHPPDPTHDPEREAASAL